MSEADVLSTLLPPVPQTGHAICAQRRECSVLNWGQFLQNLGDAMEKACRGAEKSVLENRVTLCCRVFLTDEMREQCVGLRERAGEIEKLDAVRPG